MFKIVFLTVALQIANSQLVCDLPRSLIEEIHGYQSVVNRIISVATVGEYRGQVYKDLADFVDVFGPRLAGSKDLEDAIDDLMIRMERAGLRVTTDDVVVPGWTRGEESLELVTPRHRKLNVLGLGSSPGTPPDGITAEILVVKDFDELNATEALVPGKIVVFNSEYVSYGTTGQYRGRGPYEAAKRGAVSALVRSITPFSINSPHTGLTQFLDDVTPIPAAAITLEDADTLARLSASGYNVTVNLKMGATQGEDKISRNVKGDLVGATRPEEYVTLSGHIDSWDVGQGAMDDAGGCFISWHAAALIKRLGLPTPRRTIRAIMWTAEEPGVVGALSYLAQHTDELKNWTAAFESDVGVFEAIGLQFAGNNDATCILSEIVTMMGSLNTTQIVSVPLAGSDISIFTEVPMGEALMVENKYFWFHHSGGDAMDVLKSKDLDQNMALFAATAYILADLSIQLPRGNQTAKQIIYGMEK